MDAEALLIAEAAPDAQQAADALVAEVERRHGRDNCSAIVVRWPDAAACSGSAGQLSSATSAACATIAGMTMIAT